MTNLKVSLKANLQKPNEYFTLGELCLNGCRVKNKAGAVIGRF